MPKPFRKSKRSRAEKTKLDSDLANASSRIAELETELNETREKLTALEQKHRDIDSEVSAKVVEVAVKAACTDCGRTERRR